MGQVSLTAPGEMVGRLVCGNLDNAGRFQGTAVVYGKIALHVNSLTSGHITGKSIDAPTGAVIRAKLEIGPTLKVSPVLKASVGRPGARRGAKRLTSTRVPQGLHR